MLPLHVYNLLLLAAAVVAAPLAGLLCLVRPAWRRELGARLGLGWPEGRGRAVLWAHAASVGEVEGIVPLVRRWREANPAGEVVFSALTATGCATAHRLLPEATVRVFPLDLPCVVRHVVRRVRPGLFLFSENEIWPSTIVALERRGVPVVQVSGRLSERTAHLLARFPRFAAAVLRRVTRFCVQSAEHRDRLLALGVAADRITVTGSLKGAERAPHVAPFVERVAALGRPVLVAGSTHAGEEDAVLEAHARLCGATAPAGLGRMSRDRRPFLILAPRHPERFSQVEALLAGRASRHVRRSLLPADPGAQSRLLAEADVLLLDSIGELAGCYTVAAVAFIGGTLVPIGGHNLLEAARCGVPVVVGPHHASVAALADRLRHAGAAAVVGDADALATAVERFLGSHDDAARQASRAIAAAQAGSLEETWQALASLPGALPARGGPAASASSGPSAGLGAR